MPNTGGFLNAESAKVSQRAQKREEERRREKKINTKFETKEAQKCMAKD
jgi:hypothetical protein